MGIDRRAVIEILRQAGAKGLKRRDIASRLRLRRSQTSELRDLLEDLEQEGLVVQARRRRFQLTDKSGLEHGVLITYGSKCGVLVTRSRALGVSSSDGLGSASSGDTVLARLKSSDSPCKNIQVLKVLRRSGGYFLGRIADSDPTQMMIIHPERGVRWIGVESQSKVEPGEYVIAKLEDWSAPYARPIAKVVEVLGRRFSPGEDYALILKEFNLPAGFLLTTEKESQAIPIDISEGDRKGRLDLTDLLTFTVDPVDAKDFDDAISIERIGNRRTRVGVHIADVDHYVKEGSWIDCEALARGRSIYLVDRAIPMLPPVISSDLAALKPGVVRLTISVLIDLDQKGGVTSYRIHRSLIKSRRRLTYEEAQDLIEKKAGWRKPEKDLRMIADALKQANQVAQILKEKRLSRGAIDLEIPEIKVSLDDQGRVIGLDQAKRLESHNLIEELMILANEIVANHMSNLGRLFIYRVHEVPSEQDMSELSRFASALGYKFRWTRGTSPKALQALLERVKGRPEQYIISMFLLRSLKKARYSERNVGHFGLVSDCYTHFTSPIRRYPDLMVHRLLKKYGLDGLPIGRDEENDLAALIKQVSEISSVREIEGDEVERASIKAKVAEYFAGHIGDDYWATITGMTEFGFFVMIDDMLAEGLVHVSSLSDDYYEIDPMGTMLVGSRKGRVFRVGDRLLVRVVKVDRERREVDFVPIEFGMRSDSSVGVTAVKTGRAKVSRRFRKSGRVDRRKPKPPRL